jgi:signal peptidase I
MNDQHDAQAVEAAAKKGNSFSELVRFAIIAIAIVVPIRMFVAQPFMVNGASMDPTFFDGHYLIVDEISYRFEEPTRGAVVIFKYPLDPDKYFIKRLIGLPGETVSIKDGAVSIINKEHPEGFLLDEPYVAPENAKKDTMEFALGEKEYFVMGDNRLHSADSRLWGAVPEANLVGRPVLRLFPPAKIGTLPGNYHL